MTNRRQFIRNASLAAATGVFAASSTVSAASVSDSQQTKKSFGLQTYSLTNREMARPGQVADREFSSDVPAGLKRIKALGYSFLELAGYGVRDGVSRIGAVPIAEFKKYANDAGLEIRSTHVGHTTYPRDRSNRQQELDHWKRAFDDHKSIGCKYVIQPGDPPMVSTEDVTFMGELYNELGRLAKTAGVTFGYHNHALEFKRVIPGGYERLSLREGPRLSHAKIVYDALIEATDPELVLFELDVYWAVMGQSDPVAYIKKYPKHIRVVHIKDVAVLGESGMMNFQKIFETAYGLGIQDFIVELEGYAAGSQFDGVKGCADYLLKAPFVK